ncbi:MAG: hypothetical protein RLZZ501_2369 [Pseudomonadota bacterium]
MTESAPAVSVVMACRNVGPFLDAALASVRQQSLAAIEILLVDDGSTDDTARRARAHAAADPRLRLLEGRGEGPGAARNRALAVARGDWLAVMDGDDLIHPRRLEILLAAAGTTPAEIVADTLLAFQAGPPGRRHAYTLPAGPDWQRPVEIDLPAYLLANRLFGGGAALGYLKPLIRRDWLAARGIAYDPGLRIGEDYDLIARLLAAGARFRVLPSPLYFYRRHAGSTSHRMRAADVAALAEAGERFLTGLPAGPARAAAEARQDSLAVAWHFSTAVEALKRHRPDRAAAAGLGHPRAGLLLARTLVQAVGNRLRRALDRLPRRAPPPAALVLTAAPDPARLAELRTERRRLHHHPTDAVGLDGLAPAELTALALTLARLGPGTALIGAEPAQPDLRPFLLETA